MTASDQRRSQRKLISRRAIILRETLGFPNASISTRTINLSRTGALIEASEKLYQGEECMLELMTVDGQRAEIPGRIVWIKQDADTGYRAGVAFRNLTADEEYLLDLELVRKATT